MKEVDEKEAYEDLANAIIAQAARDYRRALIKNAMNPGSSTAKTEASLIERFFHSEYYELLTNLDPNYLIGRIKKEVNSLCI